MQALASSTIDGSSFPQLKKSVSFDKFANYNGTDQRRSFVQQLRMKVSENDTINNNNNTLNQKKNNGITQSHPNLYAQEFQNYRTEHSNETEEKPQKKIDEQSGSQSNRVDVNTKCNAAEYVNTFESDLNNIMDENTEYFNHVAGRCACGICNCGKHKCKQIHAKLKEKGPPSTVYQKDFNKHTIGDQSIPLKNDFFASFKNNQTMSLATTMKNDYKPWDIVSLPKVKEAQNVQLIPFAAKSSYRGDFINWGSTQINIEKASQQLNIIPDLPFPIKTTYRQAHGSWMPSHTMSQKKINNKAPFSTGIPFLGETTTHNTYKPFKIGPNPNYKKSNRLWESAETYPDQFKSTFMQDYSAPGKPKCQAMELLMASKKIE